MLKREREGQIPTIQEKGACRSERQGGEQFMTGMTVQERVLKVVAREGHCELSEDGLDKSFEELGLDSLDKVCIMFGLEQEFDLTIPEAEARQITTVRQIIERLSRWMEAPTAPSPLARPGVASE